MKDSSFKVAFVSLRSCLVNLPSALTRSLSASNVPAQNVVAVLSLKTRNFYVGWTGHTSANAKKIEIDPAFARSIGLTEDSEVSLELEIDPREADVVWVEPLTSDDWEIMELHASFLELNLLSQIRAVSADHTLTLYLGTHTTATIMVKKIEPELLEGQSFAKISPSAEVIISPKTRQPAHDGSLKPVSVTGGKPHARAAEGKQRSVFLRAVPDTTSELPGLHAFLPASLLRSALGLSKHIEIQIVLPPSLQQKGASDAISPQLPPKENGKQIEPAKRIVVKAHAVEDIPDAHVRLSSAVMSALDIQVGSRLRILPASSSKKVSSVTWHSLSHQSRAKEIKIGHKQESELADAFKERLSLLGEGPITHGLKVSSDFVVGLQKEGEWSLIPAIDKISFSKGDDIVTTAAEGLQSGTTVVMGVDQIKRQVRKIVNRSGGLLLYGSRGSGKTSIATCCAYDAQAEGRHLVEAQCTQLAEERVPVIKETLNQWFSTAAWYEPSVLVIDDLDRLCSAEVEHADSTRARQIAEIFLSILRQFTSRHAIALVATCQSKEALHSLLTTSHIFDETISLKPPNKAARREIAESLLTQEEAADVDWLEVANITDGYLAGDLSFLTERAKHEALMRDMIETQPGSDPISNSLQTVDYQKAILGFTPASLRGIKLQKSTVEWKDIGGLAETRQILLETLEWPTRYAPIFANCPLRLRSGLLLYGYPGCGKTLLASAVASECGLNFISVKGPEILNKYIGASEKSVRDLFDRAQAAKPCVLFFDEFDSIAPKRGHDSTGVTDRVVNQMLTQMDGAEGLDGVYVLAATSRPDLIDPALLRPGRLDKSLLCNIPTSSDRYSILQALSRKMHVGHDVDLQELAERTEGFTGADLQAVLYNAHLEAIHDAIAQKEDAMSHSQELKAQTRSDATTFTQFRLSDKGSAQIQLPKTSAELAAAKARIEAVLSNHQHHDAAGADREKSTSEESVIEIGWENMMASLNSTKPSISRDERRRLDKVYHDFVDGRSADGLPNGQSAPGEQRATLA